MEEYHIPDIANLYIFYIDKLLADNRAHSLCNDQSVFSRFNDPSLSLSDFYKRLFRGMNCCLECYIISLMYITRINSVEKGIVTNNSVKNLVVASLMLSQKFFDEICFKSEFYAEFSNIRVDEVNRLEVEFLCKIHFTIAVFPIQYKVFYQQLLDLCRDPYLVQLGVSLPAIADVSNDDCPFLKYVFTPQEQQKRQRYYQSNTYKYYNAHATKPIPLCKTKPLQPVYYSANMNNTLPVRCDNVQGLIQRGPSGVQVVKPYVLQQYPHNIKVTSFQTVVPNPNGTNGQNQAYYHCQPVISRTFSGHYLVCLDNSWSSIHVPPHLYHMPPAQLSSKEYNE